MFNKYISEFHDSIEGLIDFVALIKPVLREHMAKVALSQNDALMPLILTIAKEKATESDDKQKFDTALESFSDKIEVIESIKEDKSIKVRFSHSSEAIQTALSVLRKTGQQEEQLYKSSFLSLLSASEWFFSQILHYHYDKFPDSAGIKKKSLTLEELKTFSSVKDAEDYLIESKIEQILRGSINDWLDTLKTELNLGLSYLETIKDEIIEIYQRRNLIIHNGGVVNSIYFSRVVESQRINVKIGDNLAITEIYLENSIEKLHLTFTLIASELWKKLQPNDEQRAVMLIDFSYNYLLKSKWDIAEFSSLFHCQDKKLPIASRTSAQLNLWLCKKRGNKIKDLDKELKDADFSDKALMFQVALASLKGDKEFFFHNLSQVIRTEELAIADVFEYPIFGEMRLTEEFEKIKNENPLFIEYLKEIEREEEIEKFIASDYEEVK